MLSVFVYNYKYILSITVDIAADYESGIHVEEYREK